MKAIVNLYSNIVGEISRFLYSFYEENTCSENNLKWNKEFDNPVEITDIIGTYIENSNKYKLNMWISLDKSVFINVTEYNADKIIRYIYERFPY